MADDTTWSEKGKSSGRGKRPPKERVDDVVDALDGDDGDGGGDRRDTGESKPATASRAGNVVRSRSDDAGAKKVARAAATAGQRERSFSSRLGFPALIAAICLAGIVTVFFAWNQRDAEIRPTQADHWHAVYGVYDCSQPGDDKYLPAFQSARDDTGIHSHGDGLIHIHPFFELSSGSRAQLNHFFNEMGIDMTPEKITLDSGAELVAGEECADGSGPAEIRLLHWDWDFEAMADPPTDPEVFTDGFRDIKFEHDREVYAFVYAAADTVIPPPPEQRFVQLDNTSAAREWQRTDEEGNLIANQTGVDVGGDDSLQVEVDADGDVQVEVEPADDEG